MESRRIFWDRDICQNTGIKTRGKLRH